MSACKLFRGHSLSLRARVSTLEQQLSMAVSTVVSMGTSLNAIGNVCALATLPSYPAANMVYTLVLPTAGGTGVIQGGEVVVSAVRGSYVVGGATTVMCGSSGWVGTPPATVSQCTPNCGICTGTTDCSSCNPGYFSNVTAQFASQTLNPSRMTFDPVGAKTRGTVFNAATMNPATGIWLRGKTSLLTGTPNAGTWSNNIYYDVIGCYAPVHVAPGRPRFRNACWHGLHLEVLARRSTVLWPTNCYLLDWSLPRRRDRYIRAQPGASGRWIWVGRDGCRANRLGVRRFWAVHSCLECQIQCKQWCSFRRHSGDRSSAQCCHDHYLLPSVNIRFGSPACGT